MPKLTKKAPKKAKDARMKTEMHKFKHGSLHSGSKHGHLVKSRKQAIAIALSTAEKAAKKAGNPSKAPKRKMA
jgi:hypothetical protein